MEDNKIVKIAATGFVVLVVVPVVIGGVASIATRVVNGICTLNYNHKIKKGLKDGSIIEIDGEYYEVDKLASQEEA